MRNISVGPGGWNEQSRTVRKNDQALQNSQSIGPLQHIEGLSLKRMPRPQNRDSRRIVSDVGSVSCVS